jgi:hypothetical protein
MGQPSTQWREQIAPDEEQRFARYAQQLGDMQRAKSARYGKGRALHRRQQLGLAAELHVLPDLPPHAAHGLFAEPRRFEAWVRLSNGGADIAADARPDVRGFAIQVRGVAGPAALGGDATHQDFALIQLSAFSFPKPDEFVGLVLHATKSPLALLRYLVGRYGIGGALRELRRIARTFGKPFRGFAVETFSSAAPIACGPYAARVRLRPADPGRRPIQGHAWAADVADRLRTAPLAYELQLQFFTDERTTPIEDASVDWPESESPYLTVARLTLPRQDVGSAAGLALAEKVEQSVFDPWAGLAAHRPLGEVMRARKATYFESQKQRGAV